MGKVQVWASQLWANDFPPVCAMTGRPAETWKKFRFATPPDWAYGLLLLVCLGGLGILAFAIVVAIVSQRASGYLPLTRSSSRTATLAFWIPIGVILAAPVSWVVAIPFAGDSQSSLFPVFFFLGFGFLLVGLIGRLAVTPWIAPRAKVFPIPPGQTDRIVELRNVHPAFVAAVQQHQHERAGQFAPAPQAPLLPS